MSENLNQKYDDFMILQEDPNCIIELGGTFFDTLRFVRSCLEVSRENYSTRLSANFKSKSIPVESHTLNKIIEEKGSPARILNPGQQWISGRVRVKVCIEFLPDLQTLSDQHQAKDPSTLDDLRVDI